VSFAELAEARGIEEASAIRLVRRRHWRRQRDNQGYVRALVPETWLSGQEDRSPDDPGDNPPDTTPFQAALTALRDAKDGEIATLREVVDGLRSRNGAGALSASRANSGHSLAIAGRRRSCSSNGRRVVSTSIALMAAASLRCTEQSVGHFGDGRAGWHEPSLQSRMAANAATSLRKPYTRQPKASQIYLKFFD
jgi:hypothetical protein